MDPHCFNNCSRRLDPPCLLGISLSLSLSMHIITHVDRIHLEAKVLQPNAQVTSRALSLLLWFYVNGITIMALVNA